MDDRVCLLDRIQNENVDVDKAISLSLSVLRDFIGRLSSYYISSPFCIMGKTFGEAINSVIKLSNNTINNFLDYYELVVSLLFRYYYKGVPYQQEVEQILKILNTALSNLGYGAEYDKEQKTMKCHRKDVAAEIVASTASQEVKDKIYKYLSIRDGDIDEKRSVLKNLIDDIELFCKKRSSIKEIDKTKQFLQCVRHTKDCPKKEFPFYYAEEEKWLDFIFQMVIDVLSFEDLEKRVESIIQEENKK